MRCGTVVLELAAERRGGGEEAGVAAHDHADVHAGQGAVVQVGAGEGLAHELGRRAEARAVIGAAGQVVVDGLGHVHADEVVAGGLGLLVDDAAGIGRVVAAAVEEVADVVRLHDLEHLQAVLDVGLVAGRAETGGGRDRHVFQVLQGGLGEIEEVLLEHAAHAVAGAVDVGDLREPARFEDDAYDALVDDRGRATALRDKSFAGQLSHVILHLLLKRTLGGFFHSRDELPRARPVGAHALVC